MKRNIFTSSVATLILSVFAFTEAQHSLNKQALSVWTYNNTTSASWDGKWYRFGLTLLPVCLAARHNHPGEEIIYVLEGELE